MSLFTKYGVMASAGGEAELISVGAITALSAQRQMLGAAAAGNSFGLFAGGMWSARSAVVDAYNTSLVRSTATALSVARRHLVGASVGNYAIFSGGESDSGKVNTVDMYDTALVRSTGSLAVGDYITEHAGLSFGSYALFAGGYSTIRLSGVYAYNASLVRSFGDALSVARSGLKGAKIGNYALFAGGYTGAAHVVTVDTYNASLVRSVASDLSAASGLVDVKGAANDSYALFTRGDATVMDVYNSSLVKTTISSPLTGVGNQVGITTSGYAIFSGGYKSGEVDTVIAFGRDLIASNLQKLSEAKRYHEVVAFSDKFLIGGGACTSGTSVDAYSM